MQKSQFSFNFNYKVIKDVTSHSEHLFDLVATLMVFKHNSYKNPQSSS